MVIGTHIFAYRMRPGRSYGGMRLWCPLAVSLQPGGERQLHTRLCHDNNGLPLRRAGAAGRDRHPHGRTYPAAHPVAAAGQIYTCQLGQPGGEDPRATLCGRRDTVLGHAVGAERTLHGVFTLAAELGTPALRTHRVHRAGVRSSGADGFHGTRLPGPHRHGGGTGRSAGRGIHPAAGRHAPRVWDGALSADQCPGISHVHPPAGRSAGEHPPDFRRAHEQRRHASGRVPHLQAHQPEPPDVQRMAGRRAGAAQCGPETLLRHHADRHGHERMPGVPHPHHGGG